MSTIEHVLVTFRGAEKVFCPRYIPNFKTYRPFNAFNLKVMQTYPKKVVGTFDVMGDDRVKTSDCGEAQDSHVVHVNEEEKSRVAALWKPPAHDTYFYAVAEVVDKDGNMYVVTSEAMEISGSKAYYYDFDEF